MSYRDSNLEPDPHQTERRMRREALWMIGLAVGIVVILAVEKWVLPIPSIFSFSSNVLFFALINLNVILICVLLFLILRNVAKLLFERRRNVLGSRLRTKLIVAFAGFSLVPTVMMFYVALTFVTRSIDNWFSLQMEKSLEETLDVAKDYYAIYRKNARYFAQTIAGSVRAGERADKPAPDAARRDDPDTLFNAENLASLIARHRIEYNLDSVRVFRAGASGPVAATAPTDPLPPGYRDLTGVEDLVLRAFAGENHAEIFETEGAEFVRGAAPVFLGGRVEGVVVTEYRVPADVLMKMTAIRKTYDDYRQLTLLRDPLMSTYYVFFALISAFIFFAATWFGFFLARGIAGPIRRMADATEEVATGNLDVRLESVGNDEMNRLIQSFNKMIADLKISRGTAQAALMELRHTNIELDQRRRYMETVLSNISAGVVSFQADGRVATANRRSLELLGLAESPIGRPYEEVFGRLVEADTLDEMRRRLAERDDGSGGTDRRFETDLEIKIGDETRTLLLRLSLVRSAQTGQTLYAVLVIDDLTELIKAKRVAAWREIARRIAHEIKNPLTPIQLAAQRLRKRYAARFDETDDKAFFDSTATIIRQVGEMKRLVQEFSDFARLAEVVPAPNSINEIVAETLTLYAEAHPDVAFEFAPDESLPTLLVDRSQLKRVFINLLDNAVDAVAGHGAVRITSGVDEARSEVFVHVDDNGSGLPAAYRRRLFEPYFSTKKMGTGLGLAIVHQIMTDHGGRVELRDHEPRGTRVVLAFPLTLAVAVA